MHDLHCAMQQGSYRVRPIALEAIQHLWWLMQELWTGKERVPPATILLELYPKALKQKGYMGGTAAILGKMHAAGYADILHSGFAALLGMVLEWPAVSCSLRWKISTQRLVSKTRARRDCAVVRRPVCGLSRHAESTLLP